MSFLRKGILVSGGQGVVMALGLLVNILYSRAMGPEGVGQYQVFLSSSVIVMTFAALGVGNANIYFLNNRKVPIADITTNTLKFCMAMGLLLAVAMTIVFLSLPKYFGLGGGAPKGVPAICDACPGQTRRRSGRFCFWRPPST